MKKLVIFDLDGTLLDTIADLAAATNHALQKNGFPMHDVETLRTFVGNGIGKLLERALPEEGRTADNVERLRSDFVPYYDEHNADLSQPYPGVAELLSRLQQKGTMLAVASNKYQEATEKIVRHYFPNIEFLSINGQQEGVPVKPDPSIVFDILLKAGVTKDETVFIGDSGVDMETARRACVDSIGVTWGFRPEKELIETYAVNVVHSPSEILEIIKNYSPR